MLLQFLHLVSLFQLITSTTPLENNHSLLVHEYVEDGSYKSEDEWEKHCALSVTNVVNIIVRYDVFDEVRHIRPDAWQVVEDNSSRNQRLYNPFGKQYQEWHRIIQSEAYANFKTLRIPSAKELVDMYPMPYSWKEAKTRNPNLTFRK